jgi:hypothetical protein
VPPASLPGPKIAPDIFTLLLAQDTSASTTPGGVRTRDNFEESHAPRPCQADESTAARQRCRCVQSDATDRGRDRLGIVASRGPTSRTTPIGLPFTRKSSSALRPYGASWIAARAASGVLVMRASTPKALSARSSSGLSTVHTFTARLRAWAASMSSAVAA